MRWHHSLLVCLGMGGGVTCDGKHIGVQPEQTCERATQRPLADLIWTRAVPSESLPSLVGLQAVPDGVVVAFDRTIALYSDNGDELTVVPRPPLPEPNFGGSWRSRGLFTTVAEDLVAAYSFRGAHRLFWLDPLTLEVEVEVEVLLPNIGQSAVLQADDAIWSVAQDSRLAPEGHVLQVVTVTRELQTTRLVDLPPNTHLDVDESVALKNGHLLSCAGLEAPDSALWTQDMFLLDVDVEAGTVTQVFIDDTRAAYCRLTRAGNQVIVSWQSKDTDMLNSALLSASVGDVTTEPHQTCHRFNQVEFDGERYIGLNGELVFSFDEDFAFHDPQYLLIPHSRLSVHGSNYYVAVEDGWADRRISLTRFEFCRTKNPDGACIHN